MIRKEVKQYVEEQIIPLYDGFDAAHRRDHVATVIAQSMELAKHYPETNEEMVYVIAACHDIGLQMGRENHHKDSARLMRENMELRRWFGEEEIATMADAAEDHRASAKSAPRTIYGRIVAEADRVIEPTTIVRRAVQYGIANYPELDKEGQWQRTREHMHQKYGDGGYLRLWIAESNNAQRLEELRCMIRDDERLRETFEEVYEKEKGDR